jgi:predicted AAA+ superfamily ATPase
VIQRNDYLDRLAKWREKKLIYPEKLVKVVSGVRGCGKTTLLAQYIDRLKRSGVKDEQIIFIDMENPEDNSLLHNQGLNDFIKKRLCKDALTHVFIDEIQKCAHYDKAINDLVSKKQIDLNIAVSSAPVFSGTLYVEIMMLPLSFAEHQMFSKLRGKSPQIPVRANTLPQTNVPAQKAYSLPTGRRLPRQKLQKQAQLEKYLQREAFNDYLSLGGFPFTAALSGDVSLVRQCVEGIYHTVLIKDAAGRAGIKNIPLLTDVAKTMSHAIGRPLSSTRICAAMSAGGMRISANTVETYMRALTAAFVFYHIRRFDIKADKPLKTLGKYYIADTGIRNLLLETTAPDINGQLENIVCMELLRRGFKVFVGKYGADEINFAAFRGRMACFQVAASVRDAAVFERVFSPLERIRENYPKYILTLDETPFHAVRGGIVQMNLIDWLLETRRN